MIFTESKEKQNKNIIISFNEIIPLEKCTIIKFSSIRFRLVFPNPLLTILLALISAWQSFLFKYLFETYHHRIALYTIKCFNSVIIIAINFCCWPKIENKIHYFALFDVFFSLFLCFIYMVFNNYSNHSHDMVFS